jgi:general secretion pathway protein G
MAPSSLRRTVTLLLLALIASPLPACHREPPVLREQILAARLDTMRDGLSLYAKKHGRYPGSLEEMVATGEISEIPVDPTTNSRTTWRLVREESVAVDEFSTAQTEPQLSAPIVDIRSGGSGTDARGVPWSEY